MKHIITRTLSVVATLAAIGIGGVVHAETIETRIGKLSFTHGFANGYPTKETVEKLYDERAAYFYEGGPTTKAMVTKTPGIGQAYLSAYKDKDGNWLDGANTYRLHVLANPPVKQFWSVTIYDISTRCLISNPQKIADRSSRQPDLVKNPDGSVDIYVGPTAPQAFEKNWIPSVPGKAWFAWFRLYAPLEPFFDKSWPVQDFEKVERQGRAPFIQYFTHREWKETETYA